MTLAAPLSSMRWGVVGGGMLGLTLAHRLAQAGQRVTVFESAPEIGGLAAAWELGGVVWDKHYHVTLLSDSHLRALLDELGVDETMRWVETKTGFYADGRLHSMSNTLEFLRFPPLRFVDKLRLGATIFAASRRRNGKPLEKVLVADWLRKWSGERTFRKIWLPLLQAKLGDCYRRTSAAFIWATIQRMYAARRTGLKKEMFGYVPGGYARVLRRLADVLAAEGVALRTSATADRIMARSDGLVAVAAAGAWHDFDRVVIACPSTLVPGMLPQLGDEQRRRHDGVEYLGIVCASLLVDRKLADFYVTNITDVGAPFTAVVEMTALIDPGELGGRTLIYLPRYAAAHDEAWTWSDDEVEERFLAAVERMYPAFRREHVQACRISRVRRVFALPTIDYSSRLPAMETGVPNVYAVNSAHIVGGTLNVNEVVKLANETFEDLLLPSIPRGESHRDLGTGDNVADESLAERDSGELNGQCRAPRASMVESH